MSKEKYRKCLIYFDPPPIGIRTMDWHWYHEEYDGAPDDPDHRAGSCSSAEECKAEIDEKYDNNDMLA